MGVAAALLDKSESDTVVALVVAEVVVAINEVASDSGAGSVA